MRVEPGYNMTAWLKVGAAVGSSLGGVVEDSLVVMALSARQKGCRILHGVEWGIVTTGLVLGNLL